MNFNVKQKFIVHAVASAAVVGTLGAAYLFFLWAVNSADSALSTLVAQITELEDDREVARVAKDALGKRSADIQRLQEFFVNRQSPVEFIEALEEIQRKTGSLVAVDINETPQEMELVFRLTVEGGEKNLQNYLSAIELLPYLVRVEDLQYQKLSPSDPSVLPQSKGQTFGARMVLLIKVKTSDLSL